MGARDRHRELAGPASQAEARRLTGELRAAIEEVRSAVLVLAARVRTGHGCGPHSGTAAGPRTRAPSSG
ncbi:hypothetical protein [Kitasatospora sp. NPDC096204]|uniref:hypothetical protein n=1 Tax=Kitasatospora sp. NPDC096204 TaxID=3364094 RepID=UPI003823713A